MKMILGELVSLCLMCWSVQESTSQLVRPGRCPKVSVQQNFDLGRYLGTWYQRATFGTKLFQGEGRCVTAMYSLNSTTGQVIVRNTQIPASITLPSMSSIQGSAELADPESLEARLLVTFSLPVLGSVKAPYWVLGTDYDSWAVVYSCVDLRLAHVLSGWILTRVQNLDHSPDKPRVETEVGTVLAQVALPRTMFTDTDQTNCRTSS